LHEALFLDRLLLILVWLGLRDQLSAALRTFYSSAGDTSLFGFLVTAFRANALLRPARLWLFVRLALLRVLQYLAGSRLKGLLKASAQLALRNPSDGIP